MALTGASIYRAWCAMFIAECKFEKLWKYVDELPIAPTTPNDHRENNSHYFTPARAKVRGAVEFCDRMGIDYFKEDIFRTFNVSNREGWRFLTDRDSSRRLQNDPNVEDHRGPQPLLKWA